MVRESLNRGLHVFCEKPFILNVADGEELIALAETRRLVNQVGYHYRFVGAFMEAARVIASGALGQVHHVRVEAYGPVVLRSKGATWRSDKSEGGGALYDYACHAIDLANFLVGPPESVSGVIRRSIFSKDVDDEIYCSLHYPDGAGGQLSVNWSDESFRKMSTKIAVWGTNGRLVADRQECQTYLRSSSERLAGYDAGWTIRYTANLAEEVWYYLRGEEYSSQVDYFARSIESHRLDGQNTFKSALQTDLVVQMILSDAPRARRVGSDGASTTAGRGFLSRIFG
jgi:predicted dehydrogenase